MKQQWRERLGTVTLEPCAPVVAGSYQQWTLTLTVGSYGIDERGTIKIAQRFACDMQPAQFSDPAAPAYCTVQTNGAAKLVPRFAPKGHERPWMRWCVVIDVYDGSLAPGDTVTVVLGERSGGSPGFGCRPLLSQPTNSAFSSIRPMLRWLGPWRIRPSFPLLRARLWNWCA